MNTPDARVWWGLVLPLLRRSRELAVIGHAESAVQFERGDLGNALRERFGDDELARIDERIADRYGVDPETLRGERWVASRIPAESRRVADGLSFSAHRVVASLRPETRDRVLAEAVARATVSHRAVRSIRREMTGEAAPHELDPEMGEAEYVAGRMVERFEWMDAGQAAAVVRAVTQFQAEFRRVRQGEAVPA